MNKEWSRRTYTFRVFGKSWWLTSFSERRMHIKLIHLVSWERCKRNEWFCNTFEVFRSIITYIVFWGSDGMARKTRSDCTVKTFEKKEGLPAGTIRNENGRDTRGDKKIGTIRKEGEKK